MKKHAPYIIIIEGIDASGKTTVSSALYDRLKNGKFTRNNGKIYPQPVCHFPDYKTISGEMIKILLNMELNHDLRKILASTFALNRLHYSYPSTHSSSDVLIFNRYYPSNFAYNYILGLEYLEKLEKHSYVGSRTFILDIDPSVSVQRRPERRDLYEKDLEYLNGVRKNYLTLAGIFGWIVLDGTQLVPTLVNQIIKSCCYDNDGLEEESI